MEALPIAPAKAQFQAAPIQGASGLGELFHALLQESSLRLGAQGSVLGAASVLSETFDLFENSRQSQSPLQTFELSAQPHHQESTPAALDGETDPPAAAAIDDQQPDDGPAAAGTPETGDGSDSAEPAERSDEAQTATSGSSNDSGTPASDETGEATDETGEATDETGEATDETVEATDETGEATDETAPDAGDVIIGTGLPAPAQNVAADIASGNAQALDRAAATAQGSAQMAPRAQAATASNPSAPVGPSGAAIRVETTPALFVAQPNAALGGGAAALVMASEAAQTPQAQTGRTVPAAASGPNNAAANAANLSNPAAALGQAALGAAPRSTLPGQAASAAGDVTLPQGTQTPATEGNGVQNTAPKGLPAASVQAGAPGPAGATGKAAGTNGESSNGQAHGNSLPAAATSSGSQPTARTENSLAQNARSDNALAQQANAQAAPGTGPGTGGQQPAASQGSNPGQQQGTQGPAAQPATAQDQGQNTATERAATAQAANSQTATGGALPATAQAANSHPATGGAQPATGGAQTATGTTQTATGGALPATGGAQPATGGAQQSASLPSAATAGFGQAASRIPVSMPIQARPAAAQPLPIDQVAVQIRKAVGAGEDRIRIRLHPAELGQIDVKLKLGADGAVKAIIAVERPETFEMLQRDARGLERALQDAGLKTDSGSLSFHLRGENHEGADEQGNGPEFGQLAAEPEQQTDALTQNAPAQIMSDYAIDIRV